MDLQSALNSYNQSLGASQTAQQNLQNFQGSQRSAQDFYNQAQQQYNIPGLTEDVNKARTAVGNTQSLINNLPGAVNQQVRGQMVGEGQRQSLLGAQMAPLQSQYNTQNNAYGNAQGLYQNNLQQASNVANMGYQGQLQQYNQLNNIYQNAMAQQGQQSQAYQFWKGYGLQQQQVQAQAAQAAAQTAAIRQQLAITQAQYDDAKAAAAKHANEVVTPLNNNQAANQSQAINDYYNQQNKENSLFSANNVGNAIQSTYGDNIGKYGPLSLVGGGWLWH